MSNNKIPEFTTFQEAREFWEKHSLADFADEIEETDEVKFVRKGNLFVSLKLEKDDEKRLLSLAEKKGIKYSDLITLWVKEHLSNIKG